MVGRRSAKKKIKAHKGASGASGARCSKEACIAHPCRMTAVSEKEAAGQRSGGCGMTNNLAKSARDLTVDQTHTTHLSARRSTRSTATIHATAALTHFTRIHLHWSPFARACVLPCIAHSIAPCASSWRGSVCGARSSACVHASSSAIVRQEELGHLGLLTRRDAPWLVVRRVALGHRVA